VIDFGGATYEHDRSKSRIINTRQYRGPEVEICARASHVTPFLRILSEKFSYYYNCI
jgi:hypothetical protein